MKLLRLVAVPLWLATLASFVFVNMGNILLLEALLTQGLAVVVLASALVLAPDTPPRRRWFAFAVGEHGGLMALSLVLLMLGGGTAIERQLALGLAVASLGVLMLALPRVEQRRRAATPAFAGARAKYLGARQAARRRRADPYFYEGQRMPAEPRAVPSRGMAAVSSGVPPVPETPGTATLQ